MLGDIRKLSAFCSRQFERVNNLDEIVNQANVSRENNGHSLNVIMINALFLVSVLS